MILKYCAFLYNSRRVKHRFFLLVSQTMHCQYPFNRYFLSDTIPLSIICSMLFLSFIQICQCALFVLGSEYFAKINIFMNDTGSVDRFPNKISSVCQKTNYMLLIQIAGVFAPRAHNMGTRQRIPRGNIETYWSTTFPINQARACHNCIYLSLLQVFVTIVLVKCISQLLKQN